METIILIDDDETFTRLLKTVLELAGYRPLVVTHPDQIVGMVRQESPALVLMDIHVGDLDTMSVLRELKADESLDSIPVIMASGMDLRRECLDAGAEAFLLKPFRPSELMSRIRDLRQPMD